MEPEEFLNPSNTVYKYDQCITEEDLRVFINMLLDTADELPEHPLYLPEKEKILIAAKTASSLLDWIITGKQRDFRGMI